MGKINSWIKAARLRTLPLALSSIITGTAMACFDGRCYGIVITLAAVTAILLQILSNLANDYGDAVKGTDNEQRSGPSRTVQSGEISIREMKTGITIIAALSIVSGLFLVWEGTSGMNRAVPVIFILLGLIAVGAAITYTVGARPYGYYGLGDIMVFLFFGITGVVGVYFLNTQSITGGIFLMGASLGCFSTGVLNLNNMRDQDNDLNSGKVTLAARLGYSRAKKYHVSLILLGIACAVIYVLLNYRSGWQWLFLTSVPLFLLDIIKIYRTHKKEMLDPYLKRLSLTTFLFSILFGAGLFLS